MLPITKQQQKYNQVENLIGGHRLRKFGDQQKGNNIINNCYQKIGENND